MATHHRSLLFIGLLSALAVAPAARALEAKVFAIGDFVPAASGGCNRKLPVKDTV